MRRLIPIIVAVILLCAVAVWTCGCGVKAWLPLGTMGIPIAFLMTILAVRVDNPTHKKWIFRLAWVLVIIGVISFGISNEDHPIEPMPFGQVFNKLPTKSESCPQIQGFGELKRAEPPQYGKF